MGGTPHPALQRPREPESLSGATGDFTAVLSPDKRSVNVEGYLGPGRQLPLNQVIPLGEGRVGPAAANPALLVIASTAADLQAARIPALASQLQASVRGTSTNPRAR